MDTLPFYIYLVFGLTVLLAIALFYKATNYSKLFLSLILTWIIFQSIVSLFGFYTITDAVPPRFALLVIPPVILIIAAFNTKKGKQFIDAMDVKTLTLFQSVRVPVELVLYGLFIHKAIPGLMTFEGRNFDVLSGISALAIYYFGFIKKSIGRNILLLWNFICMVSLGNIVGNALLSFPGTFQQFAFDQPNIALLHFPFLLLPSVLVPLVLLSHLSSIRQLLKSPQP